MDDCQYEYSAHLLPASGSGTSHYALAYIIGRAERFQCGKQIAAYLGLVPLEDSSGERRRLGHITKQGSSMLRFLLVESAQMAARSIPQCTGLDIEPLWLANRCV